MRRKTYADHEREVVRLSNELISRTRKKEALPRALGPVSTSSHQTRNAPYKEHEPLLNLSRFNAILEINTHDRIALVEPKVTMEELTRATLLHGLMPEVVCEFKEITVGGAIMGAGLESSSHRFGQFNDSCLWYEVVLADGERLKIGPEAHPELFYALPGSYGTLCWVTLAAIRLIPAAPYVHCRYQEHTSRTEALKALTTPGEALFRDGVAFGPGSYLTVEGTPTEHADVPLLLLSDKRSPWYVQHLAYRTEEEAYLPIRDYLFRYDRAAFWMGQFLLSPGPLFAFLTRSKRGWAKPRGGAPRYPGPLFRLLFNNLLSSKRLYDALHRLPPSLFEETFLVQDCILPASRSDAFLAATEEAFQIAPLWLCPIKRAPQRQPLSPHSLPTDEPVLLNVGLYGVPNIGGNAVDATRHLEALTLAHGGRKGLYSHSYYTPETFWTIYDREGYEALRRDYRAEGLNHLEEKVLR
ncbi:MAG: FAD-binding oxidoreductase [Parachlamydiales bacterium]